MVNWRTVPYLGVVQKQRRTFQAFLHRKRAEKYQVIFEQFLSTTTDRAAVSFTIGESKAIIFEKAITGMSRGESKTIHVAAYQAYGPYRRELVMMVDREHFPENLTPRVGQRLQLSQGDDRTMNVTVINVFKASITLDANHPLAGKDLIYDIQLVDIV